MLSEPGEFAGLSWQEDIWLLYGTWHHPINVHLQEEPCDRTACREANPLQTEDVEKGAWPLQAP